MTGITPHYSAHDLLDPLSSRYVEVEAMPWTDGPNGTRSKVLYKDNEAREALLLIETPPGCVLSEHLHTGLEFTYVLEGSLEDDQGACKAGDFVWRPTGSQHQATTPDGAKFLTLFRGGAKSIETGQIFPNFDED